MPTKQQVIQTLRNQDWELRPGQVPAFRRFLSEYTVEPEDIPFLKRVARRSGIEIDRIKGSSLLEKIKNDLNTKVDDAAAVLGREDLNKLKANRIKRYLKIKRYVRN